MLTILFVKIDEDFDTMLFDALDPEFSFQEDSNEDSDEGTVLEFSNDHSDEQRDEDISMDDGGGGIKSK